jgi:hypothetical protein
MRIVRAIESLGSPYNCIENIDLEKGDVPLSTGTGPEVPRHSFIFLLTKDHAANVHSNRGNFKFPV